MKLLSLYNIVRIILSTFNWYIIFLFANVIARFVKKRQIIHSLILGSGLMVLFAIMFLNGGSGLFLGLPEVKIIFSLLIIYISAKESITKFELKCSENFISNWMIFCFSLYSYCLIMGQPAIRFLDSAPFVDHYLSIYFGFACALILSLTKNTQTIVVLLFVMINGSGTGIFSAAVVLLLRFIDVSILKRPGHILSLVVIFLLLLFSFFYGQSLRGRSINDLESIDRYVITMASIELMKYQDFYTHIFGRPIGDPIPILDYISDPNIYEYLSVENSDGLVYPRNMHNDYFRIYFQYGLVGFIATISVLWASFRKNIPILGGLLVGMLFNSILYITPIVFILSVLLKLSQESDLRKIENGAK